MNDSITAKKKFMKLADQSAKETDELLEEELRTLMGMASADLEALSPRMSDKETFEKLIKVVQEATRKNESLAVFKQRVTALGSGVVGLVKKVVKS